MRISLMLFALVLSGCGGVSDLVKGVNDLAGELTGTYSAPTLAGSPRPLECSDSRCSNLEAIQEKGYELARQRKITWGKFVNVFYQKRADLYPSSEDDSGASELIAYQRFLAEQMDVGRISETQWVYLNEQKVGELKARNQTSTASSRRNTTCTTTNMGSRDFPHYVTNCD